MKIAYISDMRLPTEKAHGFQIMKMCDSFSRLGASVTLIVPKRLNQIKDDPFEYYGIPKSFKIVRLPCIDLLSVSPNRLFFSILSLSFYVSVWVYTIFKETDLIYSRDALAGLFFKDFIFEVHSLPKKSWLSELVWSRTKYFLVLTGFIKERLVKAGVPEEKIMVSPDAVDLQEFNSPVSADFAKKELKLPLDKKIIGYVGSLKTMTMEKGVSAAILALKHLGESFVLCLVGGAEKDIVFYKNLAEKEKLSDRVIFIGTIKHNLIPQYLSAFDYLVAPFPENEHYNYFMSPLKIFEYMAVGRPIIASDLPSIREVLNESNAILIKPADPKELSSAIKKLADDKEFAKKISTGALIDIQKYTWNIRAEKILGFIVK
ncbi:MAG TPA: glycosyltransferase [Candidatus Paceibacterota bacterium]